MNDHTVPVHLMIPNTFPADGLRGTAAYTCDPDGARSVQAPMTQRTLNPAKATCPDCRADAPAHDE